MKKDINVNDLTATTTIFNERIDGMREVYRDDLAAFGRIMMGLLDYSIDGEIVTLPDKHENNDLRILRNMVDVGRSSTRSWRVTQLINSNLKYAESEDDMRQRLIGKGLDDSEVQEGIDRYKDREKRKGLNNLNSDGQFPVGTPWETVKNQRGY